MVGILTAGLPEESRTKRRMTEQKIDFKEALLASAIDAIRVVQWQFAQSHAKKRIKPPESILKELLGLNRKTKDDLASFESAEDFEKWYEAKRSK